MDPALRELYEEGSSEDEVSVILRLTEEGVPPAGVRVISSFGSPKPKIVTVRCQRGDIPRIHDSSVVLSTKAARSVDLVQAYSPEAAVDEALEENRAMGNVGLAGAASVPETGRGVVVGICDWGFDFTHPNFRNPDGSTRLLALWDQSGEGGNTPTPYGYGRLHSRDDINRALASHSPRAALGYDPSKGDPSGQGSHGTHVLDILAGNHREPGSQVGLARDAELVCVDLSTERMLVLENFGDSVRLLEGLDFLRGQAGTRPLVMHLSAGKTGGTHDWTGCFERAVDAMLLERPGIALVQSVGNYADSRMHTHGWLAPGGKQVLNWLISSRDRTPNELEIWYSGHDRFRVELVAPNGTRFVTELGERVKLFQDGVRWGSLYHRASEPNSGLNHVDIFLRVGSMPGAWRIELHGADVVDGRFHAWIERDAGGSHQSRFPRRQATQKCTTNTICNSYRGIAVGSFDPTISDRPPASYSSHGPTADGRQKPELSAPGHRILAARSVPAQGWRGERRLTVKSGTSMAAPWVSGTVALMMQAAGQPLPIADLRRMLIASVDAPADPSRRMQPLVGFGYLNVVKAVEAAREFGRSASHAPLQAPDPAPGEELSGWPMLMTVDRQPFDTLRVVREALQPEVVGEPAPATRTCGCNDRP